MPVRNNNINILKIIELYNSGLTLTEVAKTLNISHSTVARRLEENNIKRDKFFYYIKDGHKKCRKCQQIKSIDDFYYGRKHNYRQSTCKECDRKRARILTPEQLDRKRKQMADWNKTHKEQKSKYNKQYRIKNLNKIKEHEQKPEVKQQKNRRQRLWLKKFGHAAPRRIAKNLRARIRQAIKSGSKCDHTLNLLGCTISFLQKYLESLWKPGMSWDNYTYYGWHIDHIIPCSKFDLTKEEEQRKCFHYTNLQPLWMRDNLSKNNRIPII